MARSARDPRAGLPEVLRSPLAADRLAAELEAAASSVEGDGFLDRDRRAFLASAALQVASLGTAGTYETTAAQLAESGTTSGSESNTPERDDVEYRG